ncbi:MAG: hypothetical protein R3F62_23220 [Planctomycetota bacterium]
MSNPTSPALRRALLATLVLCLAGCKDLKIETQNDADEFRFGQPNEMWLTYKKEAVPAGVDVVWSSDEQGELSREVRLDLSLLRPGKHKITARCKHDGKEAKKSKKIKILNDRPEPSINGPAASASFGVGSKVVLMGMATDREDGPVPGSSLSWSLDGVNVGVGETVEVQDLQPGSHTLVLTATDAAGATQQVTRTFEVTNQVPQVTIAQGATGPINVLDTLEVRGSATDPDPVHGSAQLTDLEWTSSLHPGQILARGPQASLSNLKGGTHRITLSAKDEFGAIGTASFTVDVANQNPTVEILSPSSNSFFSAADTIQFEAQASDPEAAIDPTQVVWSSSKGGVFARGLSASTDSLKAGDHTIRCTVTDAHGGTDSDSITILIRNQDPEPVIVRPGPLQTRTFNFADRIRFVGEATDAEDGTVADSGLEWHYRKVDGKHAGQRGELRQNGASISVPAERLVERVGFGTFEITLVATDSDGGKATSQSRTIKIENQRTEVRLQSPTQGGDYTEGQPVQLSAVATDPDSSGFLKGDLFQWTAKELTTGQEIRLGKGESLSTTKLTAGRYQIVVEVQDPQDSETIVRATTRIEVKPAAVDPAAGIAPTVAGQN